MLKSKLKLTNRKKANIKHIRYILSIICLTLITCFGTKARFFSSADVIKTDPVTSDTVLYHDEESGRDYKISDDDFYTMFDISKEGDNSIVIAYFYLEGKDTTDNINDDKFTVIYYGRGEVYDGTEMYNFSKKPYNNPTEYKISYSYYEYDANGAPIYSHADKTFQIDSSDDLANYASYPNKIKVLQRKDDGNVLNYRKYNINPQTVLSSYVTKVYTNEFTPVGSGDFLFKGYSNVKYFDISGFDSSNVTSMNYIFASLGYESAIENEVDFSKLDTRNVTSMAYAFNQAFYNQPEAKFIAGDNFITNKIKNTSYMFNSFGYYANDVQIEFGDHCTFDEVLDTSYMFEKVGSSKAENLLIKFGNNANFSKCLNMQNMFKNVGETKSSNFDNIKMEIDLGDNFNASSCTNMDSFMYGSCFYYNSSTDNFGEVKINLGKNFNGKLGADGKYVSDLIDMDQMFYYTGQYADDIVIDLGEGFYMNNVTNMSNAFGYAMQKATKATLYFRNGFIAPNATASGSGYMYNMMAECKDINIVIGDPEKNKDSDNHNVAIHLKDLREIFYASSLNTYNESTNIVINGDVIADYIAQRFFEGYGNKNATDYNCKLLIDGDLYIGNFNYDPFFNIKALVDLEITGNIYLTGTNYNASLYYNEKKLKKDINEVIKFGNKDLTGITNVTSQLIYAPYDRVIEFYKDVKFNDVLYIGNFLSNMNWDVFYLLAEGDYIYLPGSGNYKYDYFYFDADGNQLGDKIGYMASPYIYSKKGTTNGKAPDGAEYVKKFANNTNMYVITINPNFDTAMPFSEAVEVKYNYYGSDYFTLEYGKDFTCSWKDGVDPYNSGNKVLVIKGIDVYKNLDTEKDVTVLPHKILPSELYLDDKDAIINKIEDGTSKVTGEHTLVYINPVTNEKVYFTFDEGKYFDGTNEVSSYSNNKYDIKLYNVKVVDDVTINTADTLDNYNMQEFINPISELQINNKGMINKKQSSGGGGSRKKKDDNKDVKEEKKPEVIETKKKKVIMEGYNDGTFKPDNFLTRAEFAAIIARLSDGFNEETNYSSYLNNFSDIDNNIESQWYSNYLGYLVKENIFEGYLDNSIRPDRKITRGEVSKILCLYKGYDYSIYKNKFDDVVNEWFNNYASTLYMHKIIDGRDDGSFDGNNSIKRSEVAKMISNTLKISLSDMDDVLGKIKYTDVFESDWFYTYVYKVSSDEIMNEEK